MAHCLVSSSRNASMSLIPCAKSPLLERLRVISAFCLHSELFRGQWIIPRGQWWWIGTERWIMKILNFGRCGNEREGELEEDSQESTCQFANRSWVDKDWNLFNQCLGLRWLPVIYLCLHICDFNLKSGNMSKNFCFQHQGQLLLHKVAFLLLQKKKKKPTQ